MKPEKRKYKLSLDQLKSFRTKLELLGVTDVQLFRVLSMKTEHSERTMRWIEISWKARTTEQSSSQV